MVRRIRRAMQVALAFCLLIPLVGVVIMAEWIRERFRDFLDHYQTLVWKIERHYREQAVADRHDLHDRYREILRQKFR